MATIVHEPSRLVIVEEDARLSELEPPPRGCEHTIVAVQGRGESPRSFARRVQRRVRGMEADRQRVEWTIFLLGSRSDSESQAARILIGRVLNRHASALPAKSSILALYAPAPAQWWVLALFDALLLEAGVSTLAAHIRFDQPRRSRSGSLS